MIEYLGDGINVSPTGTGIMLSKGIGGPEISLDGAVLERLAEYLKDNEQMAFDCVICEICGAGV